MRVHDRTTRAERHDHLRHAEPEDRRLAEVVQDHRRLLLRELEEGEVREHGGVVRGVEPHRPDLGCTDEALPVVRDAAVTRELGERLGREVAARDRRDVHPARVDVGNVLRPPRVADREERGAPRLAFVVEAAGRGRPAVDDRDGQAESRERGDDHGTIDRGALGEDPRGTLQQPQAVAAVVRAAAEARRAAVDHVDDRVAADGEWRAHARSLLGGLAET